MSQMLLGGAVVGQEAAQHHPSLHQDCKGPANDKIKNYYYIILLKGNRRPTQPTLDPGF